MPQVKGAKKSAGESQAAKKDEAEEEAEEQEEEEESEEGEGKEDEDEGEDEEPAVEDITDKEEKGPVRNRKSKSRRAE